MPIEADRLKHLAQVADDAVCATSGRAEYVQLIANIVGTAWFADGQDPERLVKDALALVVGIDPSSC